MLNIENGQDKSDKLNSIASFIYYLKDTIKNECIDNIVVKIRSKLDMDILISVTEHEKMTMLMIMIESNLYTKPMLQAKKITRTQNSLSVLTNNNETIKIFMYDKAEFDEIVQGKIK